MGLRQTLEDGERDKRGRRKEVGMRLLANAELFGMDGEWSIIEMRWGGFRAGLQGVAGLKVERKGIGAGTGGRRWRGP